MHLLRTDRAQTALNLRHCLSRLTGLWAGAMSVRSQASKSKWEYVYHTFPDSPMGVERCVQFIPFQLHCLPIGTHY